MADPAAPAPVPPSPTAAEAPDAASPPPPTRNPIKRLYRWVLSWAEHPAGTWALFWISFVESSFFPIPPDVLQIALSIQRPRRAFWYAGVNTAGSLAGAVLGYVIGYALRPAADWIIGVYGYEAEFARLGAAFQANAGWAVFIAALTPVPFKLVTIASGVYHEYVPLWLLLAVSAVGRPARFMTVAALLFFFGAAAKTFIDRYFELLTIVFTALLLGGFLAVKYLL
jgi:membrane protein YqaA with SNARE-associated domain